MIDIEVDSDQQVVRRVIFWGHADPANTLRYIAEWLLMHSGMEMRTITFVSSAGVRLFRSHGIETVKNTHAFYIDVNERAR